MGAGIIEKKMRFRMKTNLLFNLKLFLTVIMLLTLLHLIIKQPEFKKKPSYKIGKFKCQAQKILHWVRRHFYFLLGSEKLGFAKDHSETYEALFLWIVCSVA